MPNHKSCEKKCRVNERRRKCNLERKQRYKANVRKLKKEISSVHSIDKKKVTSKSKIEEKESSVNPNELMNEIKKQLDKIEAKHIYHKNKVARLKSKYQKMVNKFNAR